MTDATLNAEDCFMLCGIKDAQGNMTDEVEKVKTKHADIWVHVPTPFHHVVCTTCGRTEEPKRC